MHCTGANAKFNTRPPGYCYWPLSEGQDTNEVIRWGCLFVSLGFSFHISCFLFLSAWWIRVINVEDVLKLRWLWNDAYHKSVFKGEAIWPEIKFKIITNSPFCDSKHVWLFFIPWNTKKKNFQRILMQLKCWNVVMSSLKRTQNRKKIYNTIYLCTIF